MPTTGQDQVYTPLLSHSFHPLESAISLVDCLVPVCEREPVVLACHSVCLTELT